MNVRGTIPRGHREANVYSSQKVKELQAMRSVRHFIFFLSRKGEQRFQLALNEVSSHRLCGRPPLWISLTLIFLTACLYTWQTACCVQADCWNDLEMAC